MATRRKSELFLGVDVGGTKTLAALVRPSGTIVASRRADTPRKGSPEEVLETIFGVVADLLADAAVEQGRLQAIGLAVPGVVDRAAGRVVVTPNMNLSGLVVGPLAEKRFGVPVVLGNDVNMGTVGERWLGAGRGAGDVVGIFPGTGIGGGIILGGRLLEGHRGAAAEIGHIVMDVGGPLCGCGNRGCLEALASRTAIERDIRDAIEAGKKSMVTRLLDGDLSRIRSGTLKKALRAEDPVVTRVLRKASEMIGHACLTVQHVLDPEVIVLGGGVMEACGWFVLPVVAEVAASDRLPEAGFAGRIVPSLLGDDAVVLGAVAMAQERTGRDPYRAARPRRVRYPAVSQRECGEITIANKTYLTDVYVRADGKTKKRAKRDVKQRYGSSRTVGTEEVMKVCQGLPETLIVGTGARDSAELTEEAETLLAVMGIALHVKQTPEAVGLYNDTPGRKAVLFRVKC